MPIRKARTSDATSAASCITSMFAYMDATAPGALSADVDRQWSASILRAFMASGGYLDTSWVWANSNAGGRIDAVLVGGIENHDRGTGPQPWYVAKIAAIRAGVLAQVDHDAALLRPLKLALPDAVQRFGAVGFMGEFPTAWGRLRTFLQTFASYSDEVREDGLAMRVWMRFNAGLPELTARTAGLS